MCDGRWTLPTFGVGVRADRWRYHLRSAHKAENKAAGASAAVSLLFHFLYGRKLSQYTADSRCQRHLSILHLSGFYWSESCFVWTDCHSLSSTCSRQTQRSKVETQSTTKHQPNTTASQKYNKIEHQQNRTTQRNMTRHHRNTTKHNLILMDRWSRRSQVDGQDLRWMTWHQGRLVE